MPVPPAADIVVFCCRLASQGFATSTVAAQAQQQGQSFSQLKDAAKETTEVVFNPMAEVCPILSTDSLGTAPVNTIASLCWLQGEEQINAVEQAGMHRQMDESLARVSFHPDSEAAINEQIKSVPAASGQICGKDVPQDKDRNMAPFYW